MIRHSPVRRDRRRRDAALASIATRSASKSNSRWATTTRSSVPGILHFGIWNRATRHSRRLAPRRGRSHSARLHDRIRGRRRRRRGDELRRWRRVVQPPQVEPWGQKTCAIALGGGVLGFAETPWGRSSSSRSRPVGPIRAESMHGGRLHALQVAAGSPIFTIAAKLRPISRPLAGDPSAMR